MAHDTTDNRSPDEMGADDLHRKTHSTDSTATKSAIQHQQVTLDVDGLAALLHRSRSTILTDHSRNPDNLPPECTPPGTRYPLWLLEDAIAWLRAHRDHRSRRRKDGQARSRRPGRPTKAETVRRTRGGA